MASVGVLLHVFSEHVYTSLSCIHPEMKLLGGCVCNFSRCCLTGFQKGLPSASPPLPFFGCPVAYQVPRPGIRSKQTAVVTYATAAAMLDPLTHCAGPRIEPASWCRRGATNPAAPQWELHQCLFLKYPFTWLVQV